MINIADIIEAVGETSLLDCMKVMTELGLTDRHNDELRLEIEAACPARGTKL